MAGKIQLGLRLPSNQATLLCADSWLSPKYTPHT